MFVGRLRAGRGLRTRVVEVIGGEDAPPSRTRYACTSHLDPQPAFDRVAMKATERERAFGAVRQLHLDGDRCEPRLRVPVADFGFTRPALTKGGEVMPQQVARRDHHYWSDGHSDLPCPWLNEPRDDVETRPHTDDQRQGKREVHLPAARSCVAPRATTSIQSRRGPIP